MVLAELQGALEGLKAFPFRPVDYQSGHAADDEGGEEARLTWIQERPRLLIGIAARFADAVAEAGLGAEVEARAAQFRRLTADDSEFRQAYEAAGLCFFGEIRGCMALNELNTQAQEEQAKGQQEAGVIEVATGDGGGTQLSAQPHENQPPVPNPEVWLSATGMELIHGIEVWLDNALKDLFPWTPDSLWATGEITGGEHALWQYHPDIRDWQNALFRLATTESQRHVWGSFLLQKCRAVRAEADYAAFAGLAKQLDSGGLEGPIGAMRAAAEFWTGQALEARSAMEKGRPEETSTPICAETTDRLAKTQELAPARQKGGWLADAMLMVRDNPNFSDAKIASEVHVNRSTLSRSAEYKQAAEFARQKRSDPPKGHVVNAPESSVRIGLEAIAPAGRQFDDKSDRGQAIPESKYFREYCSECGEPMKVKQDEVGKKPLCESCKKP